MSQKESLIVGFKYKGINMGHHSAFFLKIVTYPHIMVSCKKMDSNPIVC